MPTEFQVQGIPVSRLADEYGTPLFVYDAKAIACQFRGLREALHPALEIFFSLKANPNITICSYLRSLGANAEVSSLGELTTARHAGIPAHDIVFPGPGKSREEIIAAIKCDIGALVCESLGELQLANQLATQLDRRPRVVIRVNPAFSSKGSLLTMGGRPRQFGIDEEELLNTPDLLRDCPQLDVIGIHVYMGTRILDEDAIGATTRAVLDLAVRVAGRLSFPLKLVDIGGGFGVAYFEGERDLDIAKLAGTLNPAIAEFAAAHPHTRLIAEAGRYLTATSGLYLTRVRYVKTSRGQRFAIVDGGTHHHLAAVGIGSPMPRDFDIRLLSRLTADAGQRWRITGPLCTPNDVLGRSVTLPRLHPGDLLGVFRSGAYGLTASPVLFLGHGSPAEIVVHEGESFLVRERDRPDDLLRQQRMHTFTQPAHDQTTLS